VRGSLCLDGKLGRRRGQVNALGGLVYLQDSSTKQCFLVDRGAAVSVFLHPSSAAPSGPPLTGADGRSIPSWGSVKKTLSFGLRTFFFLPCRFWVSIFLLKIACWSILSHSRYWIRKHCGLSRIPCPLRRGVPVLPPHSVMLHPLSAPSSLLFRRLLAMVQGLLGLNMAFVTPLRQQAAPFLQRCAVWIRKSLDRGSRIPLA
jgi:hypothetical protein